MNIKKDWEVLAFPFYSIPCQSQGQRQMDWVRHCHLCGHRLSQNAIPVLLQACHSSELQPSK